MIVKRILSLVLSICIMLTVMSFPAMASTGTTEDDFEYTVSGYYATITKYNGSASVVEIPAEIEGARVNEIGEDAFKNCTSLVEIIIPFAGTIGDNAFSGCTSLRDVYYQGTNFNWVTVGEGNECLTNATIHHHEMEGGMGGPGFDMHEMDRGYTDNCDEECNICKYRREAPHTYDGDVDLVCDGCGNVREAPVATFDYTIENDEVTITDYTGNATEVVIPSTIEGYPVTKIGSDAFGASEDVISVTVPSEVESIGSYAFYFCTSLQTVDLSEGLKVIDESAFSDCSNLTSITLPEGLTSLGDYAFEYCPKLVSVDLPKTITSIGDYAFNGCYKLSTVYYGGTETQKSAITVGTQNDCLLNATWHCTSVETTITDFEYTVSNNQVTIDKYIGDATEVTIPATIDGYPVTAIGYYAFYNCRTLISITIPDSVTMIGESAFEFCTSLTNITIPDGVTTIENSAFSSCSSLTSITIPDGVTSIGEWAFSSCSSLTSITIPDGVTSIGDYAFCNCFSLASVTIPDSIASIGDYAFSYCSLTDVYYNGTEIQKNAIAVEENNDCLLNATWHCTSIETPITDFEYTIRNNEVQVTGYIGSAAVVKIPATIEGYPVTQVGPFRDCPTIESITIPESVRGNSGPFLYESLSLVEINVDPNNEFLCSENGILFSKDKGRIIKYPSGKKDTSYNIPEGVSIIDSYAFSHCDSLATVVFPESVGQLRLFAFEGFTSLEEIVVSPDNDNFCSQDGVLFNKDKTTLIHYPRSKSGATYIVPEGVKEIGEDAFSICQNLTTVTISQSVTTIGKDAFDSCYSLGSVTLPNSVNSIGAFAFWGCHNLSNVYYNGTEIQKNAIAVEENNDCLFNATWHYVSFANPATDFEYTISNGEVTIDKYIGSATEVIIPSTIEGCHVVEIGKEAFLNCSSLTSIDVLPDNNRFSSEGGVLFDKDKTELVAYPIGKQDVTYTVPDGVKIIDASAFEFAINLTSITLPNSITTIRTAAFAHSVIMNVLYNGTKEQKANIAIAEQNEYLVDATWHYFDGFCDSTCGDCDFVREAPDHTYDTVYDAVCNECGFERVAVPEGIKYTVSNGEVTITDYNGSATTLVVPSTIEGYPVTSIGAHAFADCNSFVSVIIPDSVTSIGNSAFWDCKSLKSIIIPDNVTSIGTYVFFRNSALESATIGSGVTQISAGTFAECGSLTNVTIGSNVTSIGTYAFSSCRSLESITIPNSVREIGVASFCWCDSLTTVTFDNSATSIGESAFSECESLTSVNFGDSVTAIGKRAFSKCKSLMFSTIPDSVISIEDSAFFSCESLTSITIGEGVTSIGEGVFTGCYKLASFFVREKNEYYSSQDGVLFNKDKTVLVKYPEGKTATTYIIPNTVTFIGENAFSSCDYLINVTIPNTVTSIGKGAFWGCTRLKNINIPSSVTSIDEGAFFQCWGITNITIPDSITKISDKAFYNCKSLQSITIPNSVTSIGDTAFSSCYALVSIAIPNSVTSIGEGAFSSCSALASITIPNRVTIVDDYTFSHCASLESVTIPDGVTTIGECAFSGCTSLKSITIFDAITVMGPSAFMDCTSLKDIYYNGTKEQKDAIRIEGYVLEINSATWHYFDGPCDSTCNDCNLIREASNHVFDNLCDPDCNVCGIVRTVGDHVYDNAYDPDCNECGERREVADSNAPTFVVESKTARVGSTFTVAVSTKNNIGIVSLKLMLGYDADILELVSIEEANFEGTSFGSLTNNPIAINWEDVLNPNNTTNGTVALVTFKVKDTAVACDTEIVITYDPEDVYDENFDNVEFAVENGTITIIEYISGDVNGDGKVNNKDFGILRQYLNGWGNIIDLRAADVTGDGKVNNKDLGILRQYLNGWDVVLK